MNKSLGKCWCFKATVFGGGRSLHASFWSDSVSAARLEQNS